jgi:hypothetical protein
VAGHTDNVGEFEFNRDLSARRAKAVVAELTGKYGISSKRLFPFGVSFAAPLASNDSEEGRAKNRRRIGEDVTTFFGVDSAGVPFIPTGRERFALRCASRLHAATLRQIGRPITK